MARTAKPKPTEDIKTKRVSPRIPVLPVRGTVHFPGVIQTLLVGREMSVRALQDALNKDREAIVVGQKDQLVEEPESSDLYSVGTLSEVLHVLPLPDGTMRVVLRGMARVEIDKFVFRSGAFSAEYTVSTEINPTTNSTEALMREAISIFQQAANLGIQIPPEVSETITAIDDPGHLADTIAHHMPTSSQVKQSMLEIMNTEERLAELVNVLSRELQVLELQVQLRTKVENEVGQTQREYYLREQLKAIQQELGGEESLSDEGETYRTKLEACGMPEETLDRAMQEVRRLDRSPSSSPEGMVIRNYLDWLLALPWDTVTEDSIDVRKAVSILDRDHYGLTQVKDRIADFLAVRQVSHSLRGPILCFVGPPGVGKTSLGRSIAEALGRKFHRISLGGLRDEAEIRGHRRTYIGSMPGRLIQGLKQCGTKNPVFMLDEIDKMTMDFRGDPTSALLEALDPEQNANFSDHYIEAPFDLSAVMFICTANLLENIPAPLRDRMEVIRFPSYTEREKMQIAKQYLLPEKISEHGLKKSQLKVQPKAMEAIIREYTREAGVRSLNREIATVCRKTARKIAELGETKVDVTTENLSDFLGRSKYRYGLKGKKNEIGLVTGLVYSEYGGDIIAIEVALTEPYAEQPTIQLTGSLGDVMKESAYAAMSYVRANQRQLSSEEFRYDVHLHVPEGGVPKDGPSAGVGIFTAIVSAFTKKPVRCDIAMTGEITLRGKVLPVGGIREKVLAAHRSGIRTIILPTENERDLDDLPEIVRNQIKFHFVENAEDVLELALA
ncbi:MAG: endopeptidase La [Fimbriimonadaceae bacterium]|nr:endopeptidase La [Fimbriimonadaceae bacterium]